MVVGEWAGQVSGRCVVRAGEWSVGGGKGEWPVASGGVEIE